MISLPLVVILHVEEDATAGRKMKTALEAQGFRTWATCDVLVGDSTFKELESRIATGAPVIVLASRTAVGTEWLLKLVSNVRSQHGDEILLPVKLEKQAAVDRLGFLGKVADCSASFEQGVQDLCKALRRHGPSAPPEADIALLKEGLRQHNLLRLKADVRDKYSEDLYVARALESQLADFVKDPRDLASRFRQLLHRVLGADPNRGYALSGLLPRESRFSPPIESERLILQKAMDLCTNESVLAEPSFLEKVTEAILPNDHATLVSLLASYRDYVKSNTTNLSATELHRRTQFLIGKIVAAGGPEKAVTTVERALMACTEAVDTRDANADAIRIGDVVRIAARLSAATSRSEPAKQFQLAMREIDQTERLLLDWALSRVLAIEQVGDRSTLRIFHAGEVLRQCESLLDTAARTCLIVVDVAGSGKTNLLSSLATRIGEGPPTIVLYAKALDNHRDAILGGLDRCATQCGFGNFEKLVEHHHAALDQARQHIVVMLDGINEFPDERTIREALLDAMARFENRRVRFVTSCRDIYWKYFASGLKGPRFRLSDGQLRLYSQSEFDAALKKYLTAFGLRQVRLGKPAKEAFRLPILLRFFCEAYGRRGLHGTGRRLPDPPASVPDINLKRLFDDYLAAKLDLIVEKREAKGTEIKEAPSLEKLVFGLAHAMHRGGSSVLSHEAVVQTLGSGDLNSRQSVLQSLLGEDIIIEERQGSVYFVYEAFMEYAIAKSILVGSSEESLRSQLDEMIGGAQGFHNLRGAVLMGLVILAEDRQLSLLMHVLGHGSDWFDIVCEAVSQVRVDRIASDAIQALATIAERGNRRYATMAVATMLTRCGSEGRIAGMRILRSATRRRQAPFIAALKDLPDAKVVKALLSEHDKGNQNAEAVLLRATLNRRAVENLLNQLEESLREGKDSERRSVLIARMMGNAPPGERKKVRDVLMRVVTSHSDETVRSAAKQSLQTIETKLAKGEQTRRARIRKSRLLRDRPQPPES